MPKCLPVRSLCSAQLCILNNLFLDFGFSSYLLARENTEPGPDGAPPSKASGISPEKWRSDWPFSDWDAGIVWLLEPRRSHVADRWSGTLTQPNRQNKRFATMGAFAHFAMLLSEMNIVLVDLQSMSKSIRILLSTCAD